MQKKNEKKNPGAYEANREISRVESNLYVYGFVLLGAVLYDVFVLYDLCIFILIHSARDKFSFGLKSFFIRSLYRTLSCLVNLKTMSGNILRPQLHLLYLCYIHKKLVIPWRVNELRKKIVIICLALFLITQKYAYCLCAHLDLIWSKHKIV